MSMFLLPARFQPQAYINDHATDIDGMVEFDAAAAFLSAEPAVMLRITDQILKGRNDIDELAGDLAIAHDGPFVVTVDSEDLTIFLGLHGIWDLRSLSTVGMASIKARELRASAPKPDDLKEMFGGDLDHAVYGRSLWKAEVGRDATSFGYVDWLEERLSNIEDFQSSFSFDWNQHSPRGWSARLAETTIAEVLSGEGGWVYISQDKDGYWLRAGEVGAEETFPSLGLAMLAGDRMILATEDDRVAAIERELGIAPNEYHVSADYGAVSVYPKGEEAFPGLVLTSERSFIDFGPSEPEFDCDGWRDGLAKLREGFRPGALRP